MKFMKWECRLEWSHYEYNKQPALTLLDAETSEPIAKATTCIDYDFAEDETAIKDYSENEGMLETLIEAGIVEPTGAIHHSGYVAIPIVKILKMPVR